MPSKVLQTIVEIFRPVPSELSRGRRIFYHLYPTLLWCLAAVAAIRWTLYLIHLFNPELPFLPAYHPLAELLICIGYSLPAVGIHLFKRWLLSEPAQAAAWEELRLAQQQPRLSEQERWGGAKYADTVVFIGVVAFLVATGYFILRTAIAG